MAQTELRFYKSLEDQRSYLPLGSARGCKQTLSPLQIPTIKRTLSGDLVVLPISLPEDKYQSTISCQDQFPFSFDGLKVGEKIWVECLQRLITPEVHPSDTIVLQKPATPGSVLFCPHESEPYVLEMSNDHRHVLTKIHTNGHISYRPRLYMMVKDYSCRAEEWGGFEWVVHLEEI